MPDASAQCLCGSVKVETQLPSLWAAHCHCSLCRRAHGAAFVTWLGTQETSGAIVDPDAQLRWYASSTGAERGFCGRCGTMLFFRSVRWPGELHIAYASFVTPVDLAPQMHSHWENRVDWVAVDPDDGLPRS